MAHNSDVVKVSDLVARGVLHVEDGNHGEYRPLAHEFTQFGTPFIRPDDLVNGRVAFGTCDHINDQALRRIRKGKGRAGDIVFTHRATVGRIARIGASDPPFVANPGVTVWRSNAPEILDPNYLYYFMQTPAFMDQVWAQAGNTDTFPYVSLTQQRELLLTLPAVQVQREIAHILCQLDDKIEINRLMNETLEAMARALFKDWFIDFGPTRSKLEGRVPSNPSIDSLFPHAFDAEGVPQDWKPCTLIDLAELNPTERLRQGTPAPYLDMAALPTRGFWPDPPIQREAGSGARFRNGDTLCARITPCLENGKTAYVTCLGGEEVGWGSTEFIVIRPRPPVPPEFGYLLARDDNFRAYAIQSMTGTSGRQRVPPEPLRAYRMVRPPDSIFVAFGALVSPQFQRIVINARESETLASIRDHLLPRLMSGEIRLGHAGEIAEAAA
jgi:type I restriction enzyme, S subunit